MADDRPPKDHWARGVDNDSSVADIVDAWESGKDIRVLPTIGLRSDGQALLYRAKLHIFAGETNIGKTFTIMAWMVEEVNEGRPVLFIDPEADKLSIVVRMLELGAKADNLKTFFLYRRMTGPFDDHATSIFAELLMKWADERDNPVGIVHFDGLNNVMGKCGVNYVDGQQVSVKLDEMCRPFFKAGAAVTVADHMADPGKDTKGDRRKIAADFYAISGSLVKVNDLKGVAYVVLMDKKVTPSRPGQLKLVAVKDTEGGVESTGRQLLGADERAAWVATVHLEPNGLDGSRRRLGVTIDPPSMEDNAPSGEDMQRTKEQEKEARKLVLRILKEQPDEQVKSVRNLRALAKEYGYKGHAVTVDTAAKQLAGKGSIKMEMRGSSMLHTYVPKDNR